MQLQDLHKKTLDIINFFIKDKNTQKNIPNSTNKSLSQRKIQF